MEEARRGEGGGRRPVGRAPLILAGAALLLCWIPFLGVALGAAALILAVFLRGRFRVGWAVLLSVAALALGGVFSTLQLVYAPPPLDPADAEAWDDFDRLFGPEGGSAGSDAP